MLDPHQVAAFGALFVHRFEVGDKFAFGVVGAAVEGAAAPLALDEPAAAFGAGDLQLLGRGEGFGVFALGVGAAGEEFAPTGVLDHHGGAALVADLIRRFGLFRFGAVEIAAVAALGEVAAGDELPVAPFAFEQLRSAFGALLPDGFGHLE